MKTTIKTVIEDQIENYISSSKIVTLLLQSVKTVATETKKLAEMTLALKERIDLHEKIITSLYEIYKDDFDQKDAVQTYGYSKHNKDTSKPN